MVRCSPPSSRSRSYARSPLTTAGDGAAVQLTASVPTQQDGERIAHVLVSSSLAACVQVVGPITSTYRWEGSVERATEHLLLAKTSAGRADAAVAAIVEAHPYEVPEVIVTPVVGGFLPYLAWIAESTA